MYGVSLEYIDNDIHSQKHVSTHLVEVHTAGSCAGSTQFSALAQAINFSRQVSLARRPALLSFEGICAFRRGERRKSRRCSPYVASELLVFGKQCLNQLFRSSCPRSEALQVPSDSIDDVMDFAQRVCWRFGR